MKKIELSQAIGILANIGIVASLVFVTLEMQQSHRIALSERYVQLVANQIAADNAIAEHPAIWVKGNAGEELDPVERAIFEGQVRNLTDIAYFTIQVDLEMGGDVEASIDVTEFALYLKQNPGAYRVWLEREQSLAKHRGLLNPDQAFAEEWMERVQNAIIVFEAGESP